MSTTHIRSAADGLRTGVAALQSTRPGASLVAGTLSGGFAVARTGFHLRSLWIGLAMWCVTAFGFVLNDILDYAKDKAAGVNRPIAEGVLSRPAAAVFAGLLLVVAFGLSVALKLGGGVLTITVVALMLYTPAVRYLTVLKGLYVAVLCVVPLYYAGVVVQARYSLLLYGPLLVFIFGRETFMDANEMHGDRSSGLITLASALGQHFSRWAGACLMAAALGWLTFATSSCTGRIAAAVSLILVTLVLLWPRLHEDRRVGLSRLPMFAAAVAIAYG